MALIIVDFPGQSTYDTKGKTAIDSAYRYDPRFNKWLQIASLNEKRTFFHLSALMGKLFAVGGRNASGEIGELLWRYDLFGHSLAVETIDATLEYHHPLS